MWTIPRDKGWQRRAFLIFTVIVVLLLASHPELRVFIPLIDVMGLDVLMLVVGLQLWDYARPFMLAMYSGWLRPASSRAYSLLLFFFGYAGPYVDARLTAPSWNGSRA
jgi:hypothetical protein